MRHAALLSTLVAAHLSSHAQSAGVEYALRWRAGGPSTATETVHILKLQGPQKRTAYQVEYFDIGNPPFPGKTPIARRRSSDGKFELTLKYRADAVPATFDQKLACPLGGKVKVTRENDISLDATLKSYPVMSISCERQTKRAIDFPKELLVTSRGCTVPMVRLEVDGFKVKEWEFPKGRVIEISMKGTGTVQELTRFTEAASRLPLAMLKVEERSKSEAGSLCR